MATPGQIVIATTGASGANGLAAGVTVHNAAVAAGVSTVQGITNVIAQNITINNTVLIFDSTLYIWNTSINYITNP